MLSNHITGQKYNKISGKMQKKRLFLCCNILIFTIFAKKWMLRYAALT